MEVPAALSGLVNAKQIGSPDGAQRSPGIETDSGSAWNLPGPGNTLRGMKFNHAPLI